MSVILPPAGMIRPDVMGLFGVAEVFADGGICEMGEHLCSTVLYRRYSPTECHAVLRVIMPRSSAPEDGHEVSLIRAYLDALGGPRH